MLFYKRKYRRAFTIIELTIVLALIAAVSVSIISSFKNRREKEYRAACRSYILRLANWLESSKVEEGVYFNRHGGKYATYANTQKFEEWYKKQCPFYRCPYGDPAYDRNHGGNNYEYTYIFGTTYSAFTITCTCTHPDGSSPQYSSLAAGGWVR
ncbi:MAG: type II secretion system protein [Candidatus Bruticola sp.]